MLYILDIAVYAIYTRHCGGLYSVSLGPGVHVLHPTLPCTALHCTAVSCTALHCTALSCTALHCSLLHCTALHCTALFHPTLPWWAQSTAWLAADAPARRHQVSGTRRHRTLFL